MDEVYNSLPSEIQNEIKYMVLLHPVAKIIKDEVERLRCDEYYKFKDNNGCVFYKIYGRDYFANEYFRKFHKQKDKNKFIVESDGYIEFNDDNSESSEEYLYEIFSRVFFVSSATSSDEE